MESPQNSKGLIFNIYLKTEKLLICYFWYIISTADIGLNPMWLVRSFHKLSNNIKFVEFGSLDLELLNI